MAAVEPIRSAAEIERIEDLLFALDTPRGRRMFLMFEVGIMLGMRIGDMIKLRVGDLRGQQLLRFTPEKTDTHGDSPRYRAKQLALEISPSLRQVVDKMCDGQPDDAWLLPSRKGGHINRQTAYSDMREIARIAGITTPIGCHTMRKTFGYHIYQKTKDVAFLQGWFGHSSPAVTLIYIGIAGDERRKIIDKPLYPNRGRFDWSVKQNIKSAH